METQLTRKKYEDSLLFMTIEIILLPPIIIIYVVWFMASMAVVSIESILVNTLQLAFMVTMGLGLVLSGVFFGIGSFLTMYVPNQPVVGLSVMGSSLIFMILYFILEELYMRYEDVTDFFVCTINISLIGFGLLSYSFGDFSWFAAASTTLVGILGLSGFLTLDFNL